MSVISSQMRLTVLGNPDAYLKPLSAGSGYLVEAGGARILLDCGQGVLRGLAEHDVDPATLDAVVLSHFHFDHVLDFVPLLNALREGTHLFMPPGTRGNFAALGHAFAFQGPVRPPGPLHEPRPGEVTTLQRARLDFAPTRHGAAGIATRIRARGRSLVYLSDTSPHPPLVELAQKADLLVAHTLMPTVEAESDHARIHTTAATAAELAKEASARKLLLSHRYWEQEDDAFLREAHDRFESVELAAPGARYEVP